MKKVLYSIGLVSVMMFASCTEDKGTSYETADANQDENVNPNQLRGYGDNQTAAGDMGTEDEWRHNSEQAANQMAQDMQLSPETQDRVRQVLYERERRLAELEDRYNYTETNRMGGQANNDTRNDMNENESTNLDADRQNNQGNVYEGDNAVNDENYNNLEMRQSEMNDERELVNADTDRELQAILTPEQYRQYEQNRENYIRSNSGMNNSGNNNMDNAGNGNMNNSGNNNNMNNSGTNNQGNNNSNRGTGNNQ